MLRFHARFSDYEVNQAKHMQETFREIIHEMVHAVDPDADAEAAYGLEPVGRIVRHDADGA